MKNKTFIFIFFLSALFFFDQVSKSWARTLQMPRPEGETIFAIYPMANERGLLGFLPAFPELLVSFLAAFAVFVIARNYRQELTPLAVFAFALFLAGIFGNSVDRFFLGHVTDWLFIYPGVVMNLADIFIALGSMVTIFFLWSREKRVSRF